MPANLVKGQDAYDVAAYVAQCAASTDKATCPGIVTGSGGMGPTPRSAARMPFARRLAVQRPDVQGPLRHDREAHERL